MDKFKASVSNENPTRDIVLVGFGKWGSNLARELHQLKRLAGAYDSSQTARSHFRKSFPQLKLYSSMAEILKATHLKAVVIASPSPSHFNLANQVLAAGKSVFVEKPLATNHAHATQLQSLALEMGQVLFVGHIMEYHPGFKKLHALVFSNTIGAVKTWQAQRLNTAPSPCEENIIWDLAIHDVGMALQLHKTHSCNIRLKEEKYNRQGLVDQVCLCLEFPSGSRGEILVSWRAPAKSRWLNVVGERGSLHFDPAMVPFVLFQDPSGNTRKFSYSQTSPLTLECRAFIDALDSGQSWVASIKRAVDTIAILEATQAQYASFGKQSCSP